MRGYVIDAHKPKHRTLWEITNGFAIIEALWNCGLDTREIASTLMIEESQIYNALAKIREENHAHEPQMALAG